MFDKMENDPLNDLANSFSKVEDHETAVFQMILHPLADSKWKNIARHKSEQYFKDKKEVKIFS
jgi:hypothetical protein